MLLATGLTAEQFLARDDWPRGSQLLVHRRSSPEVPTFDDPSEVPSDEVLASPLLPGFGVPVESLFVW